MTDKPYIRLSKRMAVTVLLASLVPLYVFGMAIYWYLTNAQEEQQKESLRNLAVNQAKAIGLYLAERTSLVEVLVESASLEQLSREGELEKVLNLLNQRAKSFLDLGIIGANGYHVAYVGPYHLERLNYSESTWFLKTKVHGVYVSDVFLGYRGVPHFVVAVRKGHNPDSWILRATIDSDVFTQLVRSAQLSARGDAYIINQFGLYQTPPRFAGQILEPAGIQPQDLPVGRVTVRDRVTPDGRRVFSAFYWLEKEGWLLVVEEERASHGVAAGVVVAILALGSAIISGAVLFLLRLMIRQFEAQERRRAALDAQLAHSARLVSLGRMAAGVAHEINNPLAAIGELAGLVEDLMDEELVKASPNGELFRDNIIKIQQHVDRARGVTHRLLGFARRMEPHWDMVDINQVLKETYSFLEKEAMFRGVQVTLDLEAGLSLMKSDQAQLQQVFLNLLDNALDAVKSGGHVTIRSRRNGDGARVTFADDGPGVPPDCRDRIFDPFFTTKAPGEGSGLGLSISYSIMQKLGGDLRLLPDGGPGAVFEVNVSPAGE